MLNLQLPHCSCTAPRCPGKYYVIQQNCHFFFFLFQWGSLQKSSFPQLWWTAGAKTLRLFRSLLCQRNSKQIRFKSDHMVQNAKSSKLKSISLSATLQSIFFKIYINFCLKRWRQVQGMYVWYWHLRKLYRTCMSMASYSKLSSARHVFLTQTILLDISQVLVIPLKHRGYCESV